MTIYWETSVEADKSAISFVLNDGDVRVAGVLAPPNALGVLITLAEALETIGLQASDVEAVRTGLYSGERGVEWPVEVATSPSESLELTVHKLERSVELHVDGSSVSICNFIDPERAVRLAQALLSAAVSSGQVSDDVLVAARESWDSLTKAVPPGVIVP